MRYQKLFHQERLKTAKQRPDVLYIYQLLICHKIRKYYFESIRIRSFNQPITPAVQHQLPKILSGGLFGNGSRASIS